MVRRIHRKTELMRSVLEIFELMHNNIDVYHKLKSRNKWGLCHLLSDLWARGIIKQGEKESAMDYIYDHKPFLLKFHNPYFWKPGKLKPRKRYIKRQIKKLRDGN
jgi:hypothetical protein